MVVKKTRCGGCGKVWRRADAGVQCDGCDGWFHAGCAGVSDEQLDNLAEMEKGWWCEECVGESKGVEMQVVDDVSCVGGGGWIKEMLWERVVEGMSVEGMVEAPEAEREDQNELLSRKEGELRDLIEKVEERVRNEIEKSNIEVRLERLIEVVEKQKIAIEAVQEELQSEKQMRLKAEFEVVELKGRVEKLELRENTRVEMVKGMLCDGKDQYVDVLNMGQVGDRKSRKDTTRSGGTTAWMGGEVVGEVVMPSKVVLEPVIAGGNPGGLVNYEKLYLEAVKVGLSSQQVGLERESVASKKPEVAVRRQAIGRREPEVVVLGSSMIKGVEISGVRWGQTYKAAFGGAKIRELGERVSCMRGGDSVRVVVVQVGGNDVAYREVGAKVEKDLKGLLGKIREKFPVARVLVSGVLVRRGITYNKAVSVGELYERVCRECDASFIDSRKWVGSEYLARDRVHLNDQGKTMLGELLGREIVGCLERDRVGRRGQV